MALLPTASLNKTLFNSVSPVSYPVRRMEHDAVHTHPFTNRFTSKCSSAGFVEALIRVWAEYRYSWGQGVDKLGTIHKVMESHQKHAGKLLDCSTFQKFSVNKS